MNREWQTIPFGELSHESAFGPRFGGEDYAQDGNIACLRTTDLDNHGRISYEKMPLARLDHSKFENHFLQVDDLVISRSGTCGITAVFEGFPRPVVPGAFLIRFRLKKNANPRFYKYYFNSKNGRRHILSVAAGAVQQNINITNVKNLDVPYPPIEEQDRIVSILSAYDDLIENNQRRIKILEEMAQSLYREWFVHFRFPGHESARFTASPLGQIPEGWEVVPFTEIAEILSGGTPKTTVDEFWNGEIPFFSPKDAPQSFYVLDTEKKITGQGLLKCASKLYEKDTIFITARGTVGKVSMASRSMAMNQSCYALKGKHGFTQKFLFLTTKEQVAYLKTNTGGATFDTIVVDTFRRMMVVKPPVLFADQFTSKVTPIVDAVDNLLKRNQTLSQTRDLLLPKLLAGDSSVDRATSVC
jgi:type I restriction enzyme S subunit